MFRDQPEDWVDNERSGSYLALWHHCLLGVWVEELCLSSRSLQTVPKELLGRNQASDT